MDWPSVIVALVPVVTMGFVWALREVLPKLPKFSIPVLALVVGWALTYVTTLMGGPGVSPFVAALLGAASTWLYEISKQIKEYMAAPPPQPTA